MALSSWSKSYLPITPPSKPLMACFVKLQLLGRGAYGEVRLAINLPGLLPFPHDHDLPSPLDRSFFAVKSSPHKSLRFEGALLRLLRHNPYVLHCYGEDTSIENNNKIIYSLLLEYAPAGSLKSLIHKQGPLSDFTVRRFTRMILKGLMHVHQMGYVHCDINPGNILVFPFMGDEAGMVKIADFGRAKFANIDDGRRFTGLGRSRATPDYASPESVQGMNEAPMDIWALGCVAVEMLTGKTYKDCEPCDFMELSYEAGCFMSNCLVREHRLRLNARELLNHPFLREDDPAHYHDKCFEKRDLTNDPCNLVRGINLF